MRDDRARLIDMVEAIESIEKYVLFGKKRFSVDIQRILIIDERRAARRGMDEKALNRGIQGESGAGHTLG